MAILPRYKRMQRRDWKDPFSWFNWMMMKKAEVPLLFQFQGGVDPRYGLSSFPAGTFARADASTCATYIDGNGVVQTVAANIPRYQHVDPSNPSLGQLLLLEGSRTNLCLRNRAIDGGSGWTAENGCVSTLSQADPQAGTNGALLTASGAGSCFYRSVTFTGDGTKAMSVFIKQGSGSVPEFGILDDTAGTWRHRVRATWSAGVPTLSTTAGSGTLYGVQACTGGWYRCLFSVASITAANDNRLKMFPSVSAGSDTAYFFGPQAEDATFPSSFIATAATAVTRAADSLSFGFLPVPQAMTVYADFVEGGPVANTALLEVGSSAKPRLLLYNNGTNKYTLDHEVGGSAVEKSAAASTAITNRVELRGVLSSDGSVLLGQTINSGTEANTTASSALAFGSAWAQSVLTVGSAYPAGTTPSFVAIRSLKIASGNRSLDTMRSL